MSDKNNNPDEQSFFVKKSEEKNTTATIRNTFLSEDFGPYLMGSRVIVHRIDFDKEKYYALAEMEDGELRTLEVEYLTTGGEIERERKKQKVKLGQRPDLSDEVIQATAGKLANRITGGKKSVTPAEFANGLARTCFGGMSR